MYAKIQILGTIEVVTGMHIGASGAFAAIGAVDSPIVKDVISNLPLLPGSSLKGKMRTLLAKRYNDIPSKPENDAECIKRLFGCSKDKDFRHGKLIFSDAVMENREELREKGIQSMTEVKFENTIDRLTAVAMPRQIERAMRGSKFNLDIIYEADDETKIEEDLKIVHEGLKLLEYDYLGGNGSRGYGKVKFSDISVECAVGEIDDEMLQRCNDIFA